MEDRDIAAYFTLRTIGLSRWRCLWRLFIKCLIKKQCSFNRAKLSTFGKGLAFRLISKSLISEHSAFLAFKHQMLFSFMVP